MLSIVSQPMSGQLCLVGLRVVLAGVQLLIPVAHDLAVRAESLDVPREDERIVNYFCFKRKIKNELT